MNMSGHENKCEDPDIMHCTLNEDNEDRQGQPAVTMVTWCNKPGTDNGKKEETIANANGE